MANSLQPHKVGLALGGMFGLVHLAWSVLIAFGWAEPFMGFAMKLHMVQPTLMSQPYASPVKALPFSFGSAVALVIISTLAGYVIGYVFALIWNKVQA